MNRTNSSPGSATATGAAVLALAAGMTAAVPGPVLAQDQGASIEEVIVTAQRREQSLQDTPIAVTAFSGEDLNDRLALTLAEVGNFVPNLDFSTATLSSRASFVSAVFIRGVGQPDFIVTSDPAVGIYVDGVYFGRTTGGVVDLTDIERVEVLRGPQGTLFGKNTIGGALNIVSKKPDEEFGGTGELTFGSYDRINFRGDLNVPFSDTLYGRFSVSTKHADGYGKRLDFASGEKVDEVGETDSTTGRARLRWLPTTNFEANLSVDYTRVREPQVPDDIQNLNSAGPLVGLWNALVGFPAGTPYTEAFLTDSDFETYASGPSKAHLDLWGLSLNLEWQLAENLTVRSITAYRDLESVFSNDGDGSPLRVLGSDLVDLDQDQVSQEFHLLGKSFDDRLDWLLGAYYFQESGVEFTHAFVMPGIFQALEALPVLLGPAGPLGPCPPPGVVAALPTPGPLGCAGNPNNIPLDLDFAGTNGIEIDNYAVFGHGTFNLTDQWSITAGIRYTHEKKVHDIEYGRVNSGFVIAPPGTRFSEDWDAVTPRAGLEFRPADHLMFYFSASRGFRSGGFNGRPFFRDVVQPYDPEYLWSYELGMKSEWLDRRLVLNVAGFYNDYTDVQLTSNRATSDGNVGVFTENGGEAELTGFEVEMHARPVEQLDLIAGIGYIHAEFTEVNPAATITEDTEFVKTPKWDINLSGQYHVPLTLGTLTFRIDWAYRSKYYNDVVNNPGLVQDGFGLLNARISLEDAAERWEVAVFGTNLTDKHYITGGVGGAAAIGFDEVQYARPREWGVTLAYRF